MGGPPVKLTDDPFPTRRTVYGFIERQNLPGMFRTFDFANPDTHSPDARSRPCRSKPCSLMNSPFAMEQAGAPGQLATECAGDDRDDAADPPAVPIVLGSRSGR